MSNTEQTKKGIDSWDSAAAKDYRLALLMNLAQQAGLDQELNPPTVPSIHYTSMNYREYMITIEVLAKIRELRRIANVE